jgi:hypothetical protein
MRGAPRRGVRPAVLSDNDTPWREPQPPPVSRKATVRTDDVLVRSGVRGDLFRVAFTRCSRHAIEIQRRRGVGRLDQRPESSRP